MPKIRTMFVVLLACLALIAVACGGDDDDAEDGTTSTSVDAAADDDPADDDASDGEDEGDEPSEDDEAAPVDGDAFFDLCDGEFNQGALGGLAAINPTDPDLETSMKATVAQFNEIADAAPSEIKADFQVLADAFAKYDEVMESIDYNFLAAASDPEAAANLEELDTVFDSDALEASSANIEAWMETNCTPAG